MTKVADNLTGGDELGESRRSALDIALARFRETDTTRRAREQRRAQAHFQTANRALGSAYLIPILYVPLLMITHGFALYELAHVRPRRGFQTHWRGDRILDSV